jgi:hypothetical protein
MEQSPSEEKIFAWSIKKFPNFYRGRKFVTGSQVHNFKSYLRSILKLSSHLNLDFLATYPELSGSILGATRFSEK